MKQIVTSFFAIYSSIVCLAQSKAHEASKFAIIDPSYNTKTVSPQSAIIKNKSSWIYGASELECWRLQLLMKRKDSAKLKVGYPGVFHTPFTNAIFHLQLKKRASVNAISFRAVGNGKLLINNEFVTEFNASIAVQTISLNKTYLVSEIEFHINTTNNDVPALLIETPGISTSADSWQWKANADDWSLASHYPQNIENLPPHQLEDPTIRVNGFRLKDNLYDFGRELFGYIQTSSEQKPSMSVGESIAEAMDTTAKSREQSAELINVSKGLWRTKYPVAFRYVYISSGIINDLWTNAIFHPETYKGAFACSDTMLTRIWMNSAYTLRLCMHDFLLDGMKRDRLPWAGDLAMSSLVNAYTFSDQELVRRSLVALGREGIRQKDINGIVDFSLWWIISQDQYQLYYDDKTHLKQQWNRIKEALDILSANTDANGFLIPHEGTWLFIDWVKQEKWTALQVLWWWAQNSAGKLAFRMGDRLVADYWSKRAQKFKQQLKKAAWSENEQRWLSKNDKDSGLTRYPNFLAVVSGLSDENEYAGIKALLKGNKAKPVGSPYMAGFEVVALSRLGDIEYMLRHLKDYWGGMLSQGATTFWEAYDPGEDRNKQYSFYSRPYGKSLCHAWSSGPAAFLSSELFGLRPTADGWKRFTLNPHPGSLEWASVAVPTKHGNIIVDIKQKNIQVVIPRGTTLEFKGKSFIGPQLLQDKL